MMSDLTTFLLARIAEDEAVAREVEKMYAGSDGHTSDARWLYAHSDGPTWAPSAGMSHARLLAECKSKRLIFAEHTRSFYHPHDCPDDVRPCPTIRALLAVYSDHPDYREAWRPSASEHVRHLERVTHQERTESSHAG